jgi:hydroxypyruvate isomerase
MAGTALKGRIKQSVSRWCYNKIPFPEFAKACAEMGLQAIELLKPDEFPVLKEHGLVCAMTSCGNLQKGLNHEEYHEESLASIRDAIEATAAAGFPNVICFSGNRDGIDDEQGIENCVAALKQVAGLAEKKNVTICMELLNSKRNHKDYHCDRTPWGVEVCKRVGSPRVKLLYDVYHMQIMEGDVIATIQENIDYIGHFHTGGVPGRHEIDDTQELCYPPIMKAIAESGYDGYVGHEFIPVRDPLTSLREAVQICDV